MIEILKQKTTKNYFEKFMLVFATIEPLATIPQIYQIWFSEDSSGVSLATWIFYTITSCIWLVYGIMRKDKPIIVSGVLWTSTQAVVVIGILAH
ncbi:MAG: SemiSWEET family transporter [bacterium]|nr:SemiSWEET family transporter [bacterium]